MALLYISSKQTTCLKSIVKWLLLLLEHEFTIIYKPSHTHKVANALSKLLDTTKPIGILNQTTYVALFML